MRLRPSSTFGYGTAPAALLGLCAVAFGLLIPWLGFYWDDWETILVAKLFPPSEFWNYFPPDRPLAAWTYVVFTPVLGTRPLHWHLFTLLMRWAAVLGMWWVFGTLWPKCRRQVTLAAALFAVYPVFLQQPISVAFHQHWTAYALFFLSLGLMLHSRGRGRRDRWLRALSLLAMGLHLAILEYFAGVELLRPVLLWLAARDSVQTRRDRLRLVLKRWLPYLALLIGVGAWRVWYALQDPTLGNQPVLLYELGAQPWAAVGKLLWLAIEGSFQVLLSRWAIVLQPRFIYPQGRFVPLSWAVGLLAGAALLLYLGRLSRATKEAADLSAWLRQALLIGLLAVTLGPLPYWVTGRQVLGGALSDRFAMAAMFGAALLWAALLEGLRARWPALGVLPGLLIAAAVALHLRVANDFRWSWIEQRQFYWQLYWRAPSIAHHTALLSEEDLFGYTRPTYATNLLYLQPRAGRRLPYFFYSIRDDFYGNLDPILQGGELLTTTRQFRFEAVGSDSLAIYLPNSPKCLWVLGPLDKDDPLLSPLLLRTLDGSDLDRIRPWPESGAYPPQDIFGPEPAHTWCYYFQKADLARRQGDWQGVVRLAEAARAAGYSPSHSMANSPREWLPFVEGYARLRRWAEAEEITSLAYEADARYGPLLCQRWGEFLEGDGIDEAGVQAFGRLASRLGCGG